ncbi:MAG TPA: S8 family serine peptidase [Casimicrobiaceae bacterium]|nr:S8 family serine peptidase [Casimicrobiaceae bacterium]
MVRTARVMIRAAALAGGVALSVSVALGQTKVPVDVSSLILTSTPSTAVPAGVAKGQVQVIVRLSDAPLAKAMGPNAKRNGTIWSAGQQRAYLAQLKSKQDGVMAQIAAMGGSELARLSKANNALIVKVDSKRLADIAKLSGVTKVRPVIDYEAALSETVPYIGAAALQVAGVTGVGTTVAVLDTGIDYTHYNVGGSGSLTDYANCYGASPADPRNKTLPADCPYPTGKVVGGYDFVGEDWPGTATDPKPLAPDPNPIGAPGAVVGMKNALGQAVDGSHGTHVADIAAGRSADGSHVGVAPGAGLLAVKVCSSVSTSCSGVALLQAMDFALDPNGDGDISDAVDVVNMSLGSNYGQREDDLSEASANASRFGVVVVAAAGNAGDRPYIVSSPSTTPEVISVAQTQVPSALAYPLIINSPPSIAGSYPNTATVDWAPVGAGVTGDVVFVGRGCPAGSITPTNPDDPYLTSPAGKIALIDRGACAVSLKVDRAAKAGAIGVLIGLVAAGDPISFSYGGGDTFVPTLVITQAVSNLIKTALQTSVVNATFSPATAIGLIGSMVGSSARGPSYSYNAIKPDIGAPGASVSAVSGTGTQQSAFGGTSGATPMIAGSAALLLSANSSLSPSDVKARLMNSAETNITTNPALAPGVLAPITRIGGGEVRVDKANALGATAFAEDDPVGVGLSFGYNTVTGTPTFTKKVVVENYTANTRTFSITPSYRFADDASSGAVVISAPSSVTVSGHGSKSVLVKLSLDASKLPAWAWDAAAPSTASLGGSQGGNGPLLTTAEFDGYLTFSDSTDTFHVPWHVLPRKADNLKVASTSLALHGGSSGNIGISNIGGAVAGAVNTFALTGTSSRFPVAFLPQPGDNFAIIDLKAVGVRFVPGANAATTLAEFAINTFAPRSHPAYPAEFDIYIDSNNDGVFDYVIFNLENGGFGASGQTVVAVLKLKPDGTPDGSPIIRFFANADLDSGNIIMPARLSDLGLTPSQKFSFLVLAFDNYFTGALTDLIGPMTFTLGTPRFATDGGTGFASFLVPIGASESIAVNKVAGGDTASPSQSGILLLYRDAKQGFEGDAVAVTP